jgi:hypothetical protein
MATTASALTILVRVTGLFQIVLGSIFWSGNALGLIPVHMLTGLVLIAGLWTLAVMAIVSGAQRPLGIVALVWGALVLWLGMAQNQLLLGSTHWVIQVLHLLLGIGAIGQAERLGRSLHGAWGSCCNHAATPPLQSVAP